MAVDVEGLCGPEQQNREEVGTRDEGDDEGESQDTGLFPEARWEHWEFGTVDLPEAEGNQQDRSKNEWHKGVSRVPWILVASPKQTGKEQDHTRDGEETADNVNLRNDLAV